MSQGFFSQFRGTQPNTTSSTTANNTTANMSSRKRSRNDQDVDGDVEIESASSSFRQNQPKRSRVALAAANGGSVVSDDDDEEMDGYGNASGFTAGSPEDSEREDEEDEIDDVRATQIVQKQIRAHRDNTASEEGVIEEVFCRNFMCHSKLRIKLGPLINFIIGHNGSGKSAVLTALTMCLGGNAKVTNRGASLKHLIKEGEDSASLAVKIKNQGDAAYKPDIYGRSITVERHFTRAGGLGYKIKNAQDKVISTKKEDLDDILDYFAFQLDNPINVLTQDNARQFLSNSSPAEKYKFFIRGTQLETLDRDYKLTEENYDKTQASLQSSGDDIAILKDKMEQAERLKKRLGETENLRNKLEKYQHMHAWVQVEEQENLLKVREEVVQGGTDNVREKEGDAERISGTFDGHDQAFEAAERNLTQLTEQLTPTKDEHTAYKTKFDANKTDLLDLQVQTRDIKGDVTKHRESIKKLEKSAKEEQDRIAGAEGAEHAARLEKLEDLKRLVDEAKQSQTDHIGQRAELDRRKDETFQAYENGKPSHDRRKHELEQAHKYLANLKGSQGRPFDGFQPNMDQLVRAVDQETRWRRKPVGPMGKYVRLLKPMWSSQIEKTFGGNLEAFVVTDAQDMKLLKTIMQRVNCKPNVIIGDPEPLNVAGNEPDAGVDTILRVLAFDDDLVRNQCIIGQSIEQTCLIADGDAATNFLYPVNGSRPQFVKAALSIPRGDQKMGTRYDYSKTGGEKSTSIGKWNGRPRMQTDHAEQIRMQEEVVRGANRELQHERDQDRVRRTAMEKAGQAVVAFDRRAKELKTGVQRAEDAVEEQLSRIEGLRPQDGKLQEIERQLGEAKEELESAQGSYQDAVNAKDGLNKTQSEVKLQLDAAQKQLDEALARIEKAKRRVDKAADDRRFALHEKNAAIHAVEYAQRELAEKEEERDLQLAKVEEFLEGANGICPRVNIEPGMTGNKLDQMVTRIVDDLQRRDEELGGTRDEIVAAFTHAKIAFENAKAEVEKLERLLKASHMHIKIASSLSQRYHRWQMFRKYIAMRAKIMFAYLLSERKFRGRVILDHENKQLDIAVEPDIALKSDSGREARTLSGGEKSFSTICLLLSIWEAIGSPIRCLDEFDVFMDSVNRATSMTLMIGAARRSVGRQFVLITPQSMGNVEMGDDVKVHRMSDPERGQGVLPFTQA